VNQVPFVTVGKVIPINLQFRGRRWDFDAVQREIRRCVGLANTHSLQDVVEQIHGWWQTQTVVLIFHNLDTMDAKYMQEFIQRFWLPLVDKAINVPCQSPYYNLLMFLVDNSGCVDTWSFDCVEQLDASWKPHVPIRPPRLSLIQSDDLINWVRHECAVLPSGILNIQIEEILKQSSDGVPQTVLEYICELCGCDWYEKEHIWIKY
jgi:inactive STAND